MRGATVSDGGLACRDFSGVARAGIQSRGDLNGPQPYCAGSREHAILHDGSGQKVASFLATRRMQAAFLHAGDLVVPYYAKPSACPPQRTGGKTWRCTHRPSFSCGGAALLPGDGTRETQVT